MSWIDKINNKKVRKDLEEFQVVQGELEDEELEEIMPKVVEFYNDPPKDKDVYRLENGQCILLIQTPARIKGNKNGKEITLNKPKPLNTNYPYADSKFPDKTFKQWCNALIYGETVSVSVFGSYEQWLELDFGNKAFVKCTNLKVSYKLLNDTGNPVGLDKFLKDCNIKGLEDLDENDYRIYYTVNVQQVIK